MPQRSNPNTRQSTSASRARSVPPSQRGNAYRQPPLGGQGVRRPPTAGPLPPMYGPGARQNFQPGPLPPNRFPPAPQFQRPGGQPQPVPGGPKAFYAPLAYGTGSGGERPGTGKSLNYAQNVRQQMLAAGRPSLAGGVVPRVPAPSGAMGASGGAPQMPFGSVRPVVEPDSFQRNMLGGAVMLPFNRPGQAQQYAQAGINPQELASYFQSGPSRLPWENSPDELARRFYQQLDPRFRPSSNIPIAPPGGMYQWMPVTWEDGSSGWRLFNVVTGEMVH